VPGYELNRDPERVPMRWDAGENAGFSTGEPWLPMGPGIEKRNVAALKEDGRSLLWLYKRLIALRSEQPALVAGGYVPMRCQNDILTFKRADRDGALLIALNVVHEPRRLVWEGEGALVFCSHLDDYHPKALRGPVLLRPDEGLIIKLNE